jgi:nitrate reductase gamma subunit
VATWGAAFHAVVAQVAGDQENQERWMGIATNLFHASLIMFPLGFVVIGLSFLG